MFGEQAYFEIVGFEKKKSRKSVNVESEAKRSGGNLMKEFTHFLLICFGILFCYLFGCEYDRIFTRIL